MQISEILRRKGSAVASISPDATVSEAIGLLASKGIGALVVTSGNDAIAGILSERDIVRSLANKAEDTLSASVGSLMTADVFTCEPTETTADLMELMTEKRFRHVPVVKDNKLCGLVSIGDVVSVRLHELEDERQQIEEYITSG